MEGKEISPQNQPKSHELNFDYKIVQSTVKPSTETRIQLCTDAGRWINWRTTEWFRLLTTSTSTHHPNVHECHILKEILMQALDEPQPKTGNKDAQHVLPLEQLAVTLTYAQNSLTNTGYEIYCY